MQVSRAVVDCLAASGIEAVFGIPGTQTLPLNEAVDAREDLRFVMARHETAVTHQAWGYAETTGRPAATLVVPGPGDLNAANGLKNAANDCTPLVHLAVETDPEIRGGEGIHETPPETYDPLVTANVLVERPAAAVAVLRDAIATALAPPTGPVRVGIPKGFLTADVPSAGVDASSGSCDRDVPTASDGNVPTAPDGTVPTAPDGTVPTASDRELSAATDLLAAAAEPAILAGGGVRAARASETLEALATRLDAPVVTTYKGKGVLPEDHALSAGTLSGSAPPALLDLLADADACLAVGTDFDAVATREWSVDLPAKLVHVTLDPGDLATGYEPAVPIVADARETLAGIDSALESRGVDAAPDPSDADDGGPGDDGPGDDGPADDRPADDPATPGRRRAARVRTDFDDRVDPLRDDEPPLTSVAALEAVRVAVPREAIVAVDAGGFRVWALNAFPASGPQSYVNPGSWASMATGLPSGIGAQVGDPDADVVVLTGDGGLLMCVHELHTAVAEGLPITVVAFANDDYAIISEEAERAFDLDDGYGWADAPVDLVALAESVGMRGERAETPTAIRTTVADAVDADEPVLVEVRTDPDEPQAGDWFSE